MAALGSVAAITLNSPDIAQLSELLSQTGFRTIDGFDQPMLTDGQIYLRLVESEDQACSITYFSRNGVAAKPGDTYLSTIFTAVAGRTTSYSPPSGEGNEVLGYVDSIAVHVPNVEQGQRDLESLGFFVLEEYGDPCFQCDMTDGLIRISVRDRTMDRMALLYETDLDDELAMYLRDIYGDRITVVGSNGNISVIRIAIHPALDVMCVQAIDLFGSEE